MSGAVTVGEQLVRLLEQHGVDTVFGIPGVHTAELYRGLSASSIRHVTPRDEQDAGFMADGYARVTGRPGVCLLITGPGLTNAITPMAQARADSIPMLVISGVNARATLGHYHGHLHELPDQAALIRPLALFSGRLESADGLAKLLGRAFAAMTSGRPGPVHIEIPLDLMEAPVGADGEAIRAGEMAAPDADAIARAAELCRSAARPVILAGGGAVRADAALRALAERLDAPVVTTANARGLLSGHPLCVPASASLAAVRALIDDADLAIAIGTQLGPTDYDVYVDGGFKPPTRLLRIDVDPDAGHKPFSAELSITADAAAATSALVASLGEGAAQNKGAERAEAVRQAALAELSPKMQAMVEVLDAIRDAVPEAVLVGDSTQLVYAGNLYWEAPAPSHWFNAATGYGALGFGPPAAVGAAIGLGGAPVVCLVGDGGFQFCLGALGTAADEKTPAIFLVWNNHGYQEIEDYMISRGVTPLGVRPSAPDFTMIAEAYGIPARRLTLTQGADQSALAPGALDLSELTKILQRVVASGGPALVEILTP